MSHPIIMTWASPYNKTAISILTQYSKFLFNRENKIIVLVYQVDEIGVVCQHNTKHVFTNSVSYGFYLDENDVHIAHDSTTNVNHYILECIIVMDNRYVHQIVFKQPIKDNESISDAVSKLMDHYQNTNATIYLSIPVPPYADHYRIASFFNNQ